MLDSLELPTGHYLRENGHGGYIISASALSAWSRCQLARFYELRARNESEAPQPEHLSITTYGSIVHHAMMAMEQAVHEGREDALEFALATFEHYWANPGELGLQITEWLPRQTFGGLRERGRIALKDAYALLRSDESWLLGLEYEFAVPLEIRGRVHTLTGFIDRLSIKKYYTKPYLSVDDYKAGRQHTYLRQNVQGTFYAYVSTLPEFWSGWPESGLGEFATFESETIARLEDTFASWGYRLHSGSHGELPLASRRFRWVNLKEIKFADGGWRNERDYARMALAVDAYVRSSEAGIYSLNTVGEVCRFCAFRKTCAGPGLPDEDAGKP